MPVGILIPYRRSQGQFRWVRSSNILKDHNRTGKRMLNPPESITLRSQLSDSSRAWSRRRRRLYEARGIGPRSLYPFPMKTSCWASRSATESRYDLCRQRVTTYNERSLRIESGVRLELSGSLDFTPSLSVCAQAARIFSFAVVFSLD